MAAWAAGSLGRCAQFQSRFGPRLATATSSLSLRAKGQVPLLVFVQAVFWRPTKPRAVAVTPVVTRRLDDYAPRPSGRGLGSWSLLSAIAFTRKHKRRIEFRSIRS